MIQEVRRNVSEFSRIKVMLKKTSGWFRFIGTTRFVKNYLNCFTMLVLYHLNIFVYRLKYGVQVLYVF